MYRVFTRTWWTEATTPGWPHHREPGAGRKHTIARNVKTEEEAHAICQRYRSTHPPGRYSRKAEYEDQ